MLARIALEIDSNRKKINTVDGAGVEAKGGVEVPHTAISIVVRSPGMSFRLWNSSNHTGVWILCVKDRISYSTATDSTGVVWNQIRTKRKHTGCSCIVGKSSFVGTSDPSFCTGISFWCQRDFFRTEWQIIIRDLTTNITLKNEPAVSFTDKLAQGDRIALHDNQVEPDVSVLPHTVLRHLCL